MGLDKGTDPHIRGEMVLTGSVLSFRIDRGVGTQVPVELRGRTILGSIREGDPVEVLGPWQYGQTLKPKWVLNLDTGVRVKSAGWTTRGQWITCFVIVLIGLAVLIAAVSFGSNFGSSKPDGFDDFKATIEAHGAGLQQQQGDFQQEQLQACLQAAFSDEARDWCNSAGFAQ
ncbi:MAG TPA: hypothetical protein VH482_28240 [Thermomicrobiales bacterium]